MDTTTQIRRLINIQTGACQVKRSTGKTSKRKLALLSQFGVSPKLSEFNAFQGALKQLPGGHGYSPFRSAGADKLSSGPITVAFASSRQVPAGSNNCPLFSITFPDRSSIFACRAGAGSPSFVDCSQSTKTGTRSPPLGERVTRGGAFIRRRGPGEGFPASFGDVARLGCLMTVKRLRTPSTRRAWRRGRGRFHRKLCRSVSS